MTDGYFDPDQPHDGGPRRAGTLPRTTSRRGFLRLSASGAVGLLLPGLFASCNDAPFDPAARSVIDLGTDTGRMNGLYALLQLKGEFFHRAADVPFAGMTRREGSVFADIREHTTAHIAYFIERLGRERIYDMLQFDFRGVDLSSRAETMKRARELADGMSGVWIGALSEINSTDDARILAKMASVHARHAAVVHDLADVHARGSGAAFAGADAVDAATGLERSLGLGATLTAFGGYFRTTLEIRG